MEYRVMRPHFGDRQYNDGETRTADPSQVQHLVPHILQPISGDVKAERKTLNKAEPPLANKTKG